MNPEDVGIPRTELVLGKHSGRHAFFKAVDELGFELGDEERQAAFQRFKALADRKGIVSSEDVQALVLGGNVFGWTADRETIRERLVPVHELAHVTIETR